ncbi:MAG: hypothetical protein IPP07_30225, partial [Holophagales bacterium]|nr:hypothetical protein [Holophagales bacterium]
MKRAALLLFLLAAIPAPAQTGLLVPTSTGRPDPRVLSLREMTVDVGVARGVARVNVRQVFENHTGEIQEGTWRFRLAPSGAVGDFAVWDGLVRIPGVIVEKKRARAIYEELTTRRIDPGLLQQGEEEDSAGGGSRPSGGAVFSEGGPYSRQGNEAARDAIPGGGSLGRGSRGAANSSPARRRRTDERRKPRGDGDARGRRLPRPAPFVASPHRRGKDGAFPRERRAARQGRRRSHSPRRLSAARLLGLPQPRREASRRPRSRALGTLLRRPAREGRV